MALLNVGDTAPAFELPDQNGATHTLAQYAGAPVVLYFYPKDDTPGCTIEACDFRDQLPEFQRVDAVVLGVSPDDEKSHARFVAKFDLPFTLLADAPPARGEAPPMCDAYGVWQEKTMFGKKSMGIVRTTYLIDANGKIAERWSPVKVDGHVAEVLEAVARVSAKA